MFRSLARLCAALLAVTLIGIASPASAHVTVSSTDATRGGFGKVVLLVPSESETASTTKLVVTLSEKTPFAFVTPQAKPGWKVSLGKKKLPKATKVGDFTITEAVRTVTWTSTGDGVPPSQFDEFALSLGMFPDVRSLSFPATQTYSDGTVVRWDQEQKGTKEPEHPAPTLQLAAAPEAGGAEAASQGESDDAARWLAAAALVVSAAALFVAVRQNR
jgi:uncharacterized protein YcnI